MRDIYRFYYVIFEKRDDNITAYGVGDTPDEAWELAAERVLWQLADGTAQLAGSVLKERAMDLGLDIGICFFTLAMRVLCTVQTEGIVCTREPWLAPGWVLLHLSEETEYTGKVVIKKSAPEANAFYLMLLATRLGEKMGMPRKKITEIHEEMHAHDYENLCAVFEREFGDWVELRDD